MRLGKRDIDTTRGGSVDGGDSEQCLAGTRRLETTVAGERRAGERWGGLRRTLARGAASLAALTFGATALSGTSAELQHRMGKTIPGATATARASIFKPFNKRSLEEKLATVPAFMVTNINGSPYLTPSFVPGEQLAVFFTNYDDANAMLKEMVQNPSYEKEARVLVVSMEKAYGMIRQGPRGTGFANEDGEEEYMAFKFEKDISSIPKARSLGVKLPRAAASVDVPLFYAEGLQVKKDGGLVKPLFMDVGDLLDAWKKAAKRNPNMPAEPPVQVFSLPEVLIQMEVSDDFQDFGFFGSSTTAKEINKYRVKGGRSKPRLGKMWSF